MLLWPIEGLLGEPAKARRHVREKRRGRNGGRVVAAVHGHFETHHNAEKSDAGIDKAATKTGRDEPPHLACRLKRPLT